MDEIKIVYSITKTKISIIWQKTNLLEFRQITLNQTFLIIIAKIQIKTENSLTFE